MTEDDVTRYALLVKQTLHVGFRPLPPSTLPIEMQTEEYVEGRAKRHKEYWSNVQKENDKIFDSFMNRIDEALGNLKKMTRPPLGLKPLWLHNEQRLDEIDQAIARYLEAKKEIPQAWVEERNQLINWIENRDK